MTKRHVYLLALPLMSTTACLDMSDQDAADDISSQASLSTLDSAAVPATTGFRICESHGQFCVGAPTIAFQDSVEETPSGRLFEVLLVDTTAGQRLVQFVFDGGMNKCVAVKNNSDLVQVRACGTDVVSAFWIPERGPDGQSCTFRNKGTSVYLSGHNDAGLFHVKEKAATADGWRQQFGIPGIASCIDTLRAPL